MRGKEMGYHEGGRLHLQIQGLMDFVHGRPDESCRDSCSSFTERRSVAIGRISGLMVRLRPNTGYSVLME